jgi:ABC-type polysaccharide/polyol phosphate transport system ATPase subunit
MEYAIEIYNLVKVYEPGIYFKQNVADILSGAKRPSRKQIVALNNVSINIPKGKITGIIGDNGSGKSTLLKIIGGITAPSSGTVKVNGTIASILEVGTGFHPDLTGRENIYFSAEMLGMSSKTVKLLESEIIDFSELEEYIDMQVKYYSSGMFMRLAFSVISHLNADIILLDEVFSVGDTAFQKKCERKLKELIYMNKSILFVSHEIGNVAQICNYFVRMEKGNVIAVGDQKSVINNYLTEKLSGLSVQEKENNNLNNLTRPRYLIKNINSFYVNVSNLNIDPLGNEIELRVTTGRDTPEIIYSHDNIYLDISYEQNTMKAIHPVIILSYQLSSFSVVCNSKFSKKKLTDIFTKNKVNLRCKIPANFLNNGLFGVTIYFLDQNRNEILYLENIMTLQVNHDNKNDVEHVESGAVMAPLKPQLEWEEI